MRKKKTELSTGRVMAELAAIGFARPGEFLCTEDLKSLSREDLAAVASLERSGTGYKLKFYDKLRALELLGKYMGLTDAQDQGDPGLLAAILESTKEDMAWDEIPEIQQPPASGNDLVESAGNGGT